MTVPSVSGKLRKVKNRSSTAPISGAGRSGRSFIVFLRKDADVHCAVPASTGHASVEHLFRHRTLAGPIFQHRGCTRTDRAKNAGRLGVPAYSPERVKAS